MKELAGKDIDENAVNELLNLSDYQQGLFISSELTLDKLVWLY